ncbi:MAG TPA: hypothetical protein GX739_07260 [Firmicutes bacterium]|nr:hypothetical protein [Bacillota bacterium]
MSNRLADRGYVIIGIGVVLFVIGMILFVSSSQWKILQQLRSFSAVALANKMGKQDCFPIFSCTVVTL